MTPPAHDTVSSLVRVTKHYDGLDGPAAVKDVTFTVAKGELILLLGPSGSGKSTLLTLLSGLQRPTAGEVYLFAKPVAEYSPGELQQLRATRIGFVFQTFLLIDSLSVVENVMLVRRFAKASLADARASAMECLRRFGVDDLAQKSPGRISQGQKQRVAIARAVANDADLLIADEPTGSLSSKQGMEIVEFLARCSREEGRAVVVASHDERIAGYASRVLRLVDGEVVS